MLVCIYCYFHSLPQICILQRGYEISEAILENPAQVTAQVDTEPVEVQAAIAALPNEALVSVQLENLLAGIDEGVTPTWARPAVQLVELSLIHI